MNNQHNIVTEERQKIFLALGIIFLLFPLGGILITTATIIILKIKNKKSFMFLFLLLAIYMGAINATKIPVSDQLNYMNAYFSVPKQSLWQSLTNIYGSKYAEDFTTKEMGYGFLNIIGYYISFGYYPLFILQFTTLLYMMFFVSIYKFFNFIKLHNKGVHIISAIFILCFFTQFFNLTIHLQRQMIATAVVFYAIIDSIIKQKVNYLFLVISITLHTSTALFLPIFLLIYIYRKIRIKNWQVLSILLVLAVLTRFLPILSSILLSSMGENNYALNRLTSAGSSTEGRVSFLFTIIFSAPMIIISLYNLFKEKFSKNEHILYLSYLYIFLFISITPDNTMQYRYFMMSYGFMPFILPLLIRKSGILSYLYLSIISTFFLFRFYLTFEDITYQYAPVEDIITNNIFNLIFYR